MTKEELKELTPTFKDELDEWKDGQNLRQLITKAVVGTIINIFLSTALCNKAQQLMKSQFQKTNTK